MSGLKPTKWAEWLPMAEWWYNTSYHTSAGMSPYEAMYGQPPPSINYHAANCEDPTVIRFVKDRIQIQQLLEDNLHKAQERMKLFADRKRSDREFIVGNEVFLRLQPYRQLSVNARRNQKLSARYYGPYVITKRIGKVAYQLELPAEAKIHNVFHVSQLKLRIGKKKTVQTSLPGVNEEGEMEARPLKILERRMIKKGNVPAVKILVQWENGSEEEATWEDWNVIKNKYPEFNP